VGKKKIYRAFQLPVILIMIGWILISCAGDLAEKTENTGEISDKLTAVDTLNIEKEEEIPALEITYYLDSLTTQAEIDSLDLQFNEKEKELIYALNRIDAYKIAIGDKLLIPDTLTGNFIDYSPFPKSLSILDSVPRTVLISRRVQAVALYEKGKLKFWGPASTGKEFTQTPAGLHYGNYKAKLKISTINKDWILPYYFNFMNFEGIGTHEYTLPGYPASHGCVRLRKEEALEIYNWANQWKLDDKGQIVLTNGNPFIVIGDYNFDKPVPWYDLAVDPKSNFLTDSEKDILKDYVVRYMKDKRNFAKDFEEINGITLPLGKNTEAIQ